MYCLYSFSICMNTARHISSFMLSERVARGNVHLTDTLTILVQYTFTQCICTVYLHVNIHKAMDIFFKRSHFYLRFGILTTILDVLDML